jgi:hypothetical protein
MKCCGKCGLELPQNGDHFDRDQSKPDGFKNWCKKCRAEKRKAAELSRAASVLETLNKTMIAAIIESRPGGTNIPHQAEMYQILMSMLGGVQGWGMHWMAQYVAAAPGSQTRERMLGQMQKMAAAVSDSNKVSMPAELMSDADLDLELKKREDRMQIVSGNFTDVGEQVSVKEAC